MRSGGSHMGLESLRGQQNHQAQAMSHGRPVEHPLFAADSIDTASGHSQA